MKKHRFNVLDIAIILTLVFFIAGAAIKAGTNGSDLFNAKAKKVTIYVLADDDSKSLPLVLNSGDAVKVSSSGALIGTVDGVVTKSDKQYIRNGEAFDIVYTSDGADAVIRIKADVVENNNGIFAAGNMFVAPGTVLQLETDNAVFSGTVTKIK